MISIKPQVVTASFLLPWSEQAPPPHAHRWVRSPSLDMSECFLVNNYYEPVGGDRKSRWEMGRAAGIPGKD